MLAMVASVSAAQLKQVTSFGTNPTSLQMYIYVPDKLAAKPPVIVAVRLPPRSPFLLHPRNDLSP